MMLPNTLISYSSDQARLLWETAGETVRGTEADHVKMSPSPSAEETRRRMWEHYIRSARALITHLPSDLPTHLCCLRRYGNTRDSLLLRNLCAPENLPPTPEYVSGTGLEIFENPSVAVAATILLAVLLVVTEPYTFATLHEGSLVQNILGVRGREKAQTAEGSQAVLEWHVEDAFTENRCDYFGLLCLRGDLRAVTLLSPARQFRLPARIEDVLREPRFVQSPDAAHRSEECALPPSPIFSGRRDDPEICFDAVYQRAADPGDVEAIRALRVLAEAVEREKVQYTLEPGDMLFMDNRRVVHGRTSYAPRWDGEDRWLLRAMGSVSFRTHRRERRENRMITW